MEGGLQRALGRNLRAYRESRGLSQEEFAELVGVHRTYLGSVERGERNLTLKTVERVADSLHLDPRRLLAPPKRSRSAANKR
jgi:transcriptional regulator with XRE-family HTH domain